jgi:hypothetical protein
LGHLQEYNNSTALEGVEFLVRKLKIVYLCFFFLVCWWSLLFVLFLPVRFRFYWPFFSFSWVTASFTLSRFFGLRMFHFIKLLKTISNCFQMPSFQDFFTSDFLWNRILLCIRSLSPWALSNDTTSPNKNRAEGDILGSDHGILPFKLLLCFCIFCMLF